MKIVLLALLPALVAVASAIVCPEDYCKDVKQPLLDCKGGILKNSGFCGCTDSCAKVEGELCRLPNHIFLGVPNLDVCDEGLECAPVYLDNGYNAICVNRTKIGNEMLASRKKRSSFMACRPDACKNAERPLLDCAGSLLKNAGWCGCTDLCAKVKGEECSPLSGLLFGMPNTGRCDKGLECRRLDLEGHVSYTCQDPSDGLMVSKRSAPKCDTACRRKTLQCTFSFVIYPGQWFSQCNLDGNFLPQQCNNKKECFCVDELTGVIDESTRALGSVDCYKSRD